MKRIIICSDGTWNRPEEDLTKDFPTNVLKVARAVAPVGRDGTEQIVFYDWGLGSYHDEVTAGAFGAGINKNIQDCYRFIVQNYAPGDELYLFGFSRGAYTVRSLAGFMNNCGVLRRSNARFITEAFNLYKDPDIHPDDEKSKRYRRRNSVKVDVKNLSRDEARGYTEDGVPKVHFIGVWDTVGALGIPLSMLSFLGRKHMFHDKKIGPNIRCARHALAIDEKRDDFKPTIWNQKRSVDIKQVWFAGCHSDVGGGGTPDKEYKTVLSDIPLKWIMREASEAGLTFSDHLASRMKIEPVSGLNESYSGAWMLAGKHERTILHYLNIHETVKQKWQRDRGYRPDNLSRRVGQHGWGVLEQ